MRRAAEDLFEIQRRLTELALARATPPAAPDKAWAETLAHGWSSHIAATAEPARRTLAELEGQGGWTFAKLMIATAELRSLAGAV